MKIIGCDFHPSWQQVAVLDSETGEVSEHKLVNGDGEAERFYRTLPVPSLIGVEACGNSQWFIELLQRLGDEVWIGDAAQIRASYVRNQKTDKRDAAHMLKLLVEGRFPRLWMPSAEQRDLRQLLISSAQAGGDPRPGEEWLAAPDAEPRRTEEAQAVDGGGTEGAARAAAGGLDGAPAPGPAGVAEDFGPADWRTGPGGQAGDLRSTLAAHGLINRLSRAH